MPAFAVPDREEHSAMSRAHRRYCATLVYALAAVLLWLALGAAQRSPALARSERGSRLERPASASELVAPSAERPRSG